MGKKFRKFIKVSAIILGVAFFIMKMIAKKQKAASYYEDEPLEQNDMQGKSVVFVEDEDDEVNADGKQGHLEATGITNHYPTFYEKFIKRGFDVVLSFFGMVCLAPVYAVTALCIKKDDPGPALNHQLPLLNMRPAFVHVKVPPSWTTVELWLAVPI